MKETLFYKNNNLSWRWENDSEIIAYFNELYWRFNETASLIFYYCDGTAFPELLKLLGNTNSMNREKTASIKSFLAALIKKGLLISRFSGERGIKKNIFLRGDSFCFAEPEINSFDMSSLGHLNFKRPRTPLRIFFTLTRDCNLKCRHCYNAVRKNDNGKGEVSNKIKDIIDKIKDAGILEVILTGGEPFLSPDIFDIIDYIRSVGIKVRINTNGLVLTDEHITELKKRENIILTLGMDGISEKTNDFIRGKGSFKAATNILEKLCRENIKLYINFTATHSNLCNLWGLRRFFRNFNISRIIVNIFIRAGRGYEHKNQLALNKLDLRLIDAFNLLNRTKTVPFVTLIKSCYAGHTEANIDYQGNFFFCELLDYPLGNVLGGNIETIWNSPLNLSLLDVDRFARPCSRCFFRKRCRGSCRAEIFAASGDLYAGNPYCLMGRFLGR